MPLVKIPGTSFVRDTNSMVLINTDETSKSDYQVKAKILQNQKQEINTIKTEMNGIKNDITELKNLMLKLLDKG
jgi:hypothetical protein